MSKRQKFRQYSFDDVELAELPNTWDQLLDFAPTQTVQEAFLKHYHKFHGDYQKIMVSISGGSDSDVMLDMIERIGYEPGTVKYVFFDTGIEFDATKRHISELEERYGIDIDRKRAKMPTAAACKKYGVPFLSKEISEYIYRLQLHHFKWEDRPFDELYAEYPNCKAALRWWCNEWGEGSHKNISRRKWLKEFMVANPPIFQISGKCCEKSKKETAHDFAKQYEPDLNVQGVRKSEGGARSTAYKSCFDDVPFGCSKLRPVFWFDKKDKEEYNNRYLIKNSDCYTVYGLTRTGCACCPFGRYFEKELEAAKQYEPKLYIVANAVFGKSYEYTRRYKAFREEMDRKNYDRTRTTY